MVMEKRIKIILYYLILISLLSCNKNDFFNSSIFFNNLNYNILFLSTSNNQSSFHLFIMNKDGSDRRLLDTLDVPYPNVSVSHSTNKIAFLSQNLNFNMFYLYIIGTDGSNLTLIDSSSINGLANWSSDDSKLVYSKLINYSTNSIGIFIYDINNKTSKQLTFSGSYQNPAFTPDGNYITLEDLTNNNINLMDLDGSNNRTLLTNAQSFEWSPRGDKIAYTAGAANRSPQIFVTNSDGSHSKQLTSSSYPSFDSSWPPFGNFNPQWTPDETKIVYQSEATDRLGTSKIFIMNSDGSSQMQLTNNSSSDQVISPDGGLILYTSSQIGNAKVYLMGIYGQNLTDITNNQFYCCLPFFVNVH